MSDEGKPAEAGESKASASAPDPARESVLKAIREVKGESAATESATTTQPKGDAAEKTTDAKPADTEEGRTREPAEETPLVLSGDDLKKYTKDTPIWDWDLKKIPEELRDGARTLKRSATKQFQSLAEERKALSGKDDKKTTQTETKETTPREGDEKTYSDSDLYDMAMGSPEGFKKAMDLYIAQTVPSLVKKTNEDEQRGQRETMEAQSTLAADAVTNLSEIIPELEDDDFKEAVAKTIESNPRIAIRVANAKTAEDMEAAIELAARRTRDTFTKKAPAKVPLDAKATDRKERERLNAGERGSIAARKGSKVGTAEEGPMNVEKSIRLAKERVNRGETVV